MSSDGVHQSSFLVRCTQYNSPATPGCVEFWIYIKSLTSIDRAQGVFVSHEAIDFHRILKTELQIWSVSWWAFDSSQRLNSNWLLKIQRQILHRMSVSGMVRPQYIWGRPFRSCRVSGPRTVGGKSMIWVLKILMGISVGSARASQNCMLFVCWLKLL